jgi:maltose alpha-D-glucosyltransferase/alpha-amylase
LDSQGREYPAPSIHGGEQSNTSAVFDNRFILKLFRRVNPGVNPDLEVGRFLTERAPLEHSPDVAGALEYTTEQGDTMTVAILHQYVSNQGDAWVYTLDELGRYLERVRAVPPGVQPEVSWTGLAPAAEGATAAETHPAAAQAQRHQGNGEAAALEAGPVEPAAVESRLETPQRTVERAMTVSLLDLAERDPPDLARELIGHYLDSAELLGQRTAEMHLALASAQDDPAFTSEPFTKLYQRSLYQSMRTMARKSLELLRRQVRHLPEAAQENARRVLDLEGKILGQLRGLADHKIHARRIRVHGDLHLGQILFTGRDFAIIDFEGEPERPIGERRIKASPLRDVAGMIRSFHYASHSALIRQTPGMASLNEAAIRAEDWLFFWYAWTAASFLKAYFAKASFGDFLPTDKAELNTLLNAYVLEKALYELSYELNNRPEWAKIPMEGVLQLAM